MSISISSIIPSAAEAQISNCCQPVSGNHFNDATQQ